jgi:hypothetical protein
MFNLAIDSKLRRYVVTIRVEDVAAGGYTAEIDFAIAAKGNSAAAAATQRAIRRLKRSPLWLRPACQQRVLRWDC